MADQYAALRFDDPAFARARIELAVARRDEAAAARWSDRLIATNPDSAGALQTAAQAWLRLGQRARAIASYRAALDLAPEDTDMMRQLANVYALAGERGEQLRLLKRVVELMPQAKDVRDELAHIAPAAPRPDEQYARPASEFLAKRSAARPGAGASLDRRPSGDDGLSERAREPVPPGGLSAPDGGGGGGVARVRVRVRERQPGGPAAGSPRVSSRRADRRGRRERGGGDGGRPGDRDVHERAQLLRALSAARARATSSSCSIGSRTSRRETSSPTTSARSSTCRAREPIGAQRIRARDAEEPHVLFQRAARARPGAACRGARRPAHLHVPALDVPPLQQEAMQPPWTEVLGHVTSRPTSRGTRWDAGTGVSSKDQFVAGRRSAAARGER